jgi:hypothetical protein
MATCDFDLDGFHHRFQQVIEVTGARLLHERI